MIESTFIERIEGLQRENITKLKDKIEFIKKRLIDEFYEIEVETITPLVTGGALGKQDSIIRASEIKTVLRWFIRYILYACGIDKEKSKRYLADIFGDTYKSSFFDVIVEGKLESDKLRSLDFEELKKRNIKKEDFGHRLKSITKDKDRGIEADRIIFPGYRFKIIFVKKRDLESLNGKEKELFELFELILQVFGFGRLYRRGFGKVLILNRLYNSMDNILKEIKRKVMSIFDIDLKIGYLEEEGFNFENIVDIEERKKVDIEECHLILHKLYVKYDWMDAIAEIAHAVCKKNKRRFYKKDIIAVFMGLPRSRKIEFNNEKIPSSVIYTITKMRNQQNNNNDKYIVYSVLLLKSKKWEETPLNNIKNIIKAVINKNKYGYYI